MSEGIRSLYAESARVAMNLVFWEHMALKIFKCTPEKAKEHAIKLNESWEKAHSGKL